MHIIAQIKTFINNHLKFIIAMALALLVPLIIRGIVWLVISPFVIDDEVNEEKLTNKQLVVQKEIDKLDYKLQLKQPKSYYMIINSASNEFSLYKGNTLITQDKCSTGSYVLLKNDNNQEWMFKTPKGEFRIQGKTVAPIWRKPDWAFVEDGLPIPPSNHQSRYERGVLGDYALSLGNGYLIHGTLYQRFLGLPVTHGCIRLNDKNLELVYKSLQVGSKVYIY